MCHRCQHEIAGRLVGATSDIGHHRTVSGEQVLGVERGQLPASCGWRGVAYGRLASIIETIEQRGTYRARSEVEEDASWKQIIPYVVLRDRGRIFLMRRTREGSDARLHDRYSIGIGGHVNPPEGLQAGLEREWSEELEADWTPDFRLVGLLNDDTDPVGAVHMGVVYLVEARGRAVAIRETEKLEGAFVAPLDILRVYDRLETWSSLVYDFLTERTAGVRLGAG